MAEALPLNMSKRRLRFSNSSIEAATLGFKL